MSFWCLHFSQKTNKKIRLYYHRTSSQIVFVCLLGELNTPKRHFEINSPLLWYLKLNYFLFIFWENWRHQKDISKLTHLYNQGLCICLNIRCMPEMGTWQTPSGQSSKKRVCTRWISRSNQLLWLSIPWMGISVVAFPTWILHICCKFFYYTVRPQDTGPQAARTLTTFLNRVQKKFEMHKLM